MKMTSDYDNDEIAKRLQTYRNDLVDSIWQWIALTALIAVPISLLRFTVTGWLPIYNAHIALGILITIISLLRHRISYVWKIFMMVGIFWTIGLLGIISYGILATSIWWMPISSMLVGILHSKKLGTIFLIIIILIIMPIAFAFITGKLVIPYDANIYITSVSAWTNLLFTIYIIPFILLKVLPKFQSLIIELLEETERNRQEIKLMAMHDTLTGLPLLNLFHDRLQIAIDHAKQYQFKVALLYIDLDGFKAINDQFGHDAGDFVLKMIANRLITNIGNNDTAARIGGDEFVVILNTINQQQDIIDSVTKLITVISEPIFYYSTSLTIGASIGIAVYPDDAEDMATLRRLADKAMYQIKKAGKNNYAFIQITP